MTTVVLNDEQAQIVRTSPAVEFQDPSGKVIGRYVLEDVEDLRIIKDRMAHPEPKSTWAEIKERLQSLETP